MFLKQNTIINEAINSITFNFSWGLVNTILKLEITAGINSVFIPSIDLTERKYWFICLIITKGAINTIVMNVINIARASGI